MKASWQYEDPKFIWRTGIYVMARGLNKGPFRFWRFDCSMKDWGSYEGQVLVLAQAVGVFVLLKQVGQALQVSLMKPVNFLTAGTVSLDDWDRSPNWKQRGRCWA